MIRVLHVFKTYQPDTFGGIERVIFELCELSPLHGVEADVLSLSDTPTGGALRPLGRHRHASFMRDLDLASTGFSLSYLAGFRRFAEAYDLIHYHFPWPYMDLVHRLARVERPYLVTYHSDIVKQKLLQRLYAPLRQGFLSQASAIVATSPNYVESSPVLNRFTPVVIPIGLSESHYPAPQPTARLGAILQDATPYVLSIGVNRHYKGYETLLAAASGIKGRIVIAGHGTGELSAEAARRGLDDVTILGDITEAEKMALLDGCAAFVFPSANRAEAFGLSLVEAAMRGRPMITCEVGTGTSLVNLDGETGRICPPGDPVALRGAIAAMLADAPSRLRFGKAARERYLRLFTGEVMAHRYCDLYRLTLGLPGS